MHNEFRKRTAGSEVSRPLLLPRADGFQLSILLASKPVLEIEVYN